MMYRICQIPVFRRTMLAVVGATLGATLPAGTPAVAVAQELSSLQEIVAVVNDRVITARELEDRIRLAMVGAGLPRTPESRDRLAPEVLNQLVDEVLQRQEANRLGAGLDSSTLREALTDIAQRNNMTWEQFSAALAREGVNARTLERQIEAQLLWRNVVTRRLGPQASVGQDEIDAEIARLIANEGRPEYLLAEILLTVDTPAREAEVRSFAQDLVTRIRQGAPFSAVAQQFSEGPGAQTGGDLGWVMEGALAPELESVVQSLGPRQVSDAIRSLEGYHILLLRDRRVIGTGGDDQSEVRLYRIGLGWPPNAPQSLLARAEQEVRAISAVRGCDAFAARARALGLDDGLDMGMVRIGELPEGVRALVRQLPVGEPTEPQRVPNGVLVYMVCERDTVHSGLPSREEIENRILNQRLNLLARRYLRDLRNAAFVDIRG